MPRHRALDHQFFKTWSSEMAYVLGFFAADGSMIRNNRGAHFIEFTTTDKILLTHVRTAVKGSHVIQRRDRKRKNWSIQYRVQFGSKEWFSDLQRLGLTERKSKTLVLPEVPRRFFPDFVRGYFDGDGCVYFAKRSLRKREASYAFSTIFTSGSKSYLKLLWAELKKYGVSGGYLAAKNRGFELKLSWRDSVALYELMYNTGDNPLLFLPRKRKKLEWAIKVLKLRE